MYNVSNDFKRAILNNARHIKAYIEIGGKFYDIQKCTLDNNIYSTDIDAFIGTFIAKSGTVKVNKQDSLQLENGSLNLFFGVQLEDGTVEQVPMGQMNVYEKTSETEFKFMDNKMLFNKKFDTTSLIYPTTPIKAAQEACRQAGIELATLNFINGNLNIPSEIFFGYDATCADVITAVAQASCTFATISRENKLEFKWFTKIDFSIPLDNQYKHPTTELSYGPINSLVLAREPQNDNVYIRDEESIGVNGLTELKFSDNPFLDIDRYTSRNAIWGRINGFSYIPFVASVPGQFHLDVGDIVMLQIEDSTYIDACIMNHTMNYAGGIKSDFSSPALTKNQINYKVASTIESRILKTELTVDKIKGEIKSEIKEITSTIENITNLDGSFLNVTGVNTVQSYDDGYSPDWQETPAVITPAILDGLLSIDLQDCELVWKRNINGIETDLIEGETVLNDILTVSKNVMSREHPYITYVCYVSYKNATKKLSVTFMLNIDGKDAIVLKIDSVNGYVFKNTGVATTMTVQIFVAGYIIDTSEKMYEYFGSEAKILWEVKHINELEFTALDSNDPRLTDNGFILTLTANDINEKATFRCFLDF